MQIWLKVQNKKGNCRQNRCDVIDKGTKKARQKKRVTKKRKKNRQWLFRLWPQVDHINSRKRSGHQVVRNILSPALSPERDISDFEAKTKRKKIFQMSWQTENLIC